MERQILTRGVCMFTLADRIKKNFCKVKLKGASVKVPGLRRRKKQTSKSGGHSRVPTAAIVNILIRSAVEEAKREIGRASCRERV